MQSNMKELLNELNKLHDLIHLYKTVCSSKNMIHHSIENIDVIISTLDSRFNELNTKVTELRNLFMAAFSEKTMAINTLSSKSET